MLRTPFFVLRREHYVLRVLARTASSGETTARPAALENVRVNHRGSHVFVTEYFLYGANIVAVSQHVRCEAVMKREATAVLGNAAFSYD